MSFDRNSWLRDDYSRRRERVIAYLGGECVRCGSMEDLQTDHVDAKQKSFDIARNLNRRWEILQKELDKCQLLCEPCHRLKTQENGENTGGNRGFGELVHGTPSGYGTYRCRCDECRAAAAISKKRAAPIRPYVAKGSADHGSASMYSYHGCRCGVCKEGQRLRAVAYNKSKSL